MSKEAKDKLQGEGDYRSARRYTDDKRAFVKAGKVKDAAAKAGEQSEEEGKAAEAKAAERAKEHDPRELRNR